MKLLKRLFFVLVLILISKTVCAQEINLRFNKISVDNGLAHSDVSSMIQDENGFIWFGTLGGLNRYDGYDIKLFFNQNNPFESVYKNRISKIIQHKDHLWLATQGGVECFNKTTEKFLNLEWKFNDNSPLDSTKLNSLYVSNEGLLYVLSSNFLKVFNIDFVEGGIMLTERFIADVPKDLTFVDMKADENGLEWVISNRGLFFVNEENGKIKIRKITVSNGDNSFTGFTGLYTKETNYLLIGTHTGFLKANTSIFDAENQHNVSASFYKIDYPYIQSENIFDVTFNITSFEKGLDNNYWIGTTYGLLNARVVGAGYEFDFFNENSSNLSASQVIALLKDKSGCLWVSNYDGGVNYVDLNQKKFNFLVHDTNDDNSISENYVRAILEDDEGNVWLGTERTGLNYYNFKTKRNTVYKHSEEIKSSISSNRIRALTQDNYGNLWVGTVEGINVYSKKTNSFFKITSGNRGDKSISHNIIFSLAKDKFGNIWAGSWINGLNKIHYENSTDYSVEKIYKKAGDGYGLSSDVITFIYADDYYPEVLVGTDNGLNHIFLNEDGTVNEILHYVGNETYEKSISSNWVWPIVRENDSTLWIGTLGGGLNKVIINPKIKEGYTAKKYSVAEGAPSADIETILFNEKKKELWLGGKGLSKFDIATEKFTNFDKEDGLVGNSFKVGSSYKGKSGRFYFGSLEGVNYFVPEDIEVNNYEANVVLTNLFVNNKSVEVGDEENGILKKALNSEDAITLNYLENNFQLQFSSLHFANPNRAHFKYRLLDYNEDWIAAEAGDRKASYSNLPYGDYIFEVMATNNDGIWSDESKTLKISILAPWWLTNWAYLLYVLFAIGLLVFGYYLIVRWFGLKKAYQISVIHEQEKESLFQITSEFFTNISHEFKTPLTLILNPLEKLINNEEGNSFKKEKYYQLMYKNAKRLLRLINELVDYRKISSNAYKIKVKTYQVSTFFEDINETFKSSAENKSIDFNVQNELTFNKLQFDRAVLEKIIFNILGNAIKFTQNGGAVTLKLSEQNEKINKKYTNSKHVKSDFKASSYVYLSIEDSGKGIGETSMEHIFERFFQADNASEIQGSGIGLTLVKSLVKIHHINLSVYSKENIGTKFVLEIPNIDYNAVFGEDAIESSVMLSKSALSPFMEKPSVLVNGTPKMYETFAKPEILLVEDNEELRSFVKDDFDLAFNVLEASNGVEALEILEKFNVQAIISDIMMPKMDGITFCRKVKEHPKFRSIPFIMLSAKFNIESQIEGVQSGADIYIPKPFSLEVLELSVLNIIKTRKQLKEKALENTFEEARKSVDKNVDDEFLKEVINCIDDNIDDVTFDVVKLCNILGISKTKLYSKIKQVTTESVGGLIRGIRLKKAAQILSSTDLNIIQVMDKVGIQSQSHFTKSFKKEYGVTPSEFVKNLKNSN